MTDLFKALSAPFIPAKISWRLGSTNGDKTKGMALAYIDSRDVMDRFNEACGPFGWQCAHTVAPDGKKVTCSIGVKNPDGGEWIWRSDGAGETDVEGEKGSYSDSLKRAAVSFGVGRYLYDLDSPWVAIEAAGRSFKIAKPEYARLEALLAKGAVNTPSKAPTAVPQAQTPAKPTVAAEAYAPASVKVPEAPLTAAAWLQLGIDRVKTLDRAGMDEFEKKHADRIARVRTMEPGLHGRLISAMKARYETLG